MRTRQKKTVYVFPGEEAFEEAGRRHFALAVELSATSVYLSEARFHALLSLECLLKAWFCEARFDKHGVPKAPKGSGRDPFATYIEARSFGHHLNDLVFVAIEHGTARRRGDLGRLMAEIPKGSVWNEERYGPPLQPADPTWTSTLRIIQLTEQLFAPRSKSPRKWRIIRP